MCGWNVDNNTVDCGKFEVWMGLKEIRGSIA